MKLEAIHRAVEEMLDSTVSVSSVVYLGSPPRRGPTSLESVGLSDLRTSPVVTSAVSASMMYAIGACEAGAHFIDFTPSETLEWPDLLQFAADRKVQIAGRDGSTGQTMLKVAIAHLFYMRNIHLKAWYSTNIIGNHDGYVLSLPGHDEIKLKDKTGVLAPLLGYDDFEHKVTIDYFRQRGDSKESWDAVDAIGWLGSPISLRLNWQGQDSMLAAPLLLDLMRLVSAGAERGLVGLQPQLGFFFKRPLAREGRSITALFGELCDFYGHQEVVV